MDLQINWQSLHLHILVDVVIGDLALANNVLFSFIDSREFSAVSHMFDFIAKHLFRLLNNALLCDCEVVGVPSANLVDTAEAVSLVATVPLADVLSLFLPSSHTTEYILAGSVSAAVSRKSGQQPPTQ